MKQLKDSMSEKLDKDFEIVEPKKCYVQTPKVFVNFKRMRRRGCGRMHLVTVSRRYTHSDARYESNELLWLQIMGQRPERTL